MNDDKWFKRELSGYTNCWNKDGEDMLIRIAKEYEYNREQMKELIADALWYNAEDICRIHCKG